MNSCNKIADIDCLIVLIVGNFENSDVGNFFTENFTNTLVIKNEADALNIINNNEIDIVLCKDSYQEDNFCFLEQIKELNQNQLTFFATNSLNSRDLLKSIDLKIDGYLLEGSCENTLLKQIKETVMKYITDKKYDIFGQYVDKKNNDVFVSKTDIAGVITYANNNICDVSEYSQNELIGSNHKLVRHQDNKASIFEDLWNTISKKKIKWEGIIKNSTKNGKAYYVKTVIIPILDKNKNIIEYIGFGLNISEKLSEKCRLTNNIESNGLSILALIQIKEYDILEEFYSNNLIKKAQDVFTEVLLSNLPDKDIFKRLYHLGAGKYALLCNFHNFMRINKNVEDYFDEIVQKTNSAILEIDEFKDELSIVLSFSYGNHKLFDDAQYGLEEAISKNKIVHNSNDACLREHNLAMKNINVIKMVKVALDNFNIISYFQPIINNKTRTIEKYESLVRLIDENNNILKPCAFLNIAKGSCYYNKITNRVLNNTFGILDKLNTEVSINISMSDIEQEETRKIFFKLLHENKKHAHKIILELLEDENVIDLDVIKNFIKKVKTQGVKIAIDDFGAGYSNFERLLIFEPDIIKIDGTLIKNIETDAFARNLVETITAFSKKQNIKTVAEYVENENIFNILNTIGVDYSQGYFFGEPKNLNFN